ncbi:unnamed protein product, partial [Laminaria digitata]
MVPRDRRGPSYTYQGPLSELVPVGPLVVNRERGETVRRNLRSPFIPFYLVAGSFPLKGGYLLAVLPTPRLRTPRYYFTRGLNLFQKARSTVYGTHLVLGIPTYPK